jgi:CheY-like chemotaxis protein
LAIVRHIVEIHGGHVAASSRGPGQGSTFKITFPPATSTTHATSEQPIERKASAASQQRPQEPPQSLEGLSVLVVDDDVDALQLIRFILTERGANVSTASSANAALELLEHSLPDVLVSDIAMPILDGYDLLKRVRSRTEDKGGKIPAIALTAYVSTADRARAEAVGFQMHASKPIEPSQLVAAIATVTKRAG